MKSLALLLVLASPAALADASFQKPGSHDCAKDPNVSINTGSGTFTLTGTCDRVSINGGSNKVTIGRAKRLSVNGSTNQVDIGTAEKIAVNGADNVITYKTGKPTISKLGTGNMITQAK